MKEQLEFIYRRHSVRKFTNAKIPQADFEALFEAATLAPSGVNIQNWHFVVIENPEQIKELAEIVVKKVHNIANRTQNEELKKSLIGKIPYQTVFKEAPYVVLVFAGEYPTAWPELLAEGVIDPEEFQRLMRPYFISALVISSLAFVLGGYVIPHANEKMLNFEEWLICKILCNDGWNDYRS